MALTFVIDRLRALRATGLRAWRSLRSTRQRVEAGVAFAAAVACVVAAAVQAGPALAETKIEGEAVPDDVLAAIVVGATSCPAVTGPRLAAQMMAASRFEPNAKTGEGEGLANLDAADWKKWAPWQRAQRTDVLANVLALAHRTCKFVGQARESGVAGDLWEAAIAADSVGLEAVVKAKGVPERARKHVDTVAGYANWYADEPDFTGAEQKTREQVLSATPGPVKIPDEYVPLVLRAGRVCDDVLPAPRVAAQLMALSAFNPNYRGPNGGQGIAQFTASMWERYRPSAGASVWDPQAAIPAMGSAMCDLWNQLSGMKTADAKSDPYNLALAAYQWGVTAVRAEGGVPRKASVTQLTDLAAGYVEGYSADTRLAPEKPAPEKPKPGASTPSTSASTPPAPQSGPSSSDPQPAADPSKATETTGTKAPEKPATKPAAPVSKKWNAADRWQISNALTGRVADVPGDDVTKAGNTIIGIWNNQKAKDQYWHISDAPDAGWVVITNAFSNKALGVRDRSTVNGVKVVMLTPAAADHNQQWQLRDGGNGTYFIVNRNSGKALDLNGDDCCGDNGTPIGQWDLQSRAVDQHWKLRK
ncbi:RICIN domain-containing protein [Actinoplanes sp. NBRC 103695]|uniref:RICIN domain-containing protein n=1 Tax=Actinoplanes sp. NBRC 103695 TaxID=3032202 RepID=UPI0024A25883|nr:RICIN domain-containing protein [Actinoplanes sp. NBRC 103695]GLZ01994.1 hypothetical protein Acsp02_92450 [Actinoplanes sp. NBRC 103695]